MEPGPTKYRRVLVGIRFFVTDCKISLRYLTILSRVGAKCPLLPTIKNGFVVDTTKDYFYGDEARVQCNRGYKLSGSNIIQCGPNQLFDNVPTCEGKDCKYFDLDLHFMTDGYFIAASFKPKP